MEWEFVEPPYTPEPVCWVVLAFSVVFYPLLAVAAMRFWKAMNDCFEAWVRKAELEIKKTREESRDGTD